MNISIRPANEHEFSALRSSSFAAFVLHSPWSERPWLCPRIRTERDSLGNWMRSLLGHRHEPCTQCVQRVCARQSRTKRTGAYGRATPQNHSRRDEQENRTDRLAHVLCAFCASLAHIRITHTVGPSVYAHQSQSEQATHTHTPIGSTTSECIASRTAASNTNATRSGCQCVVAARGPVCRSEYELHPKRSRMHEASSGPVYVVTIHLAVRYAFRNQLNSSNEASETCFWVVLCSHKQNIINTHTHTQLSIFGASKPTELILSVQQRTQPATKTKRIRELPISAYVSSLICRVHIPTRIILQQNKVHRPRIFTRFCPNCRQIQSFLPHTTISSKKLIFCDFFPEFPIEFFGVAEKIWERKKTHTNQFGANTQMPRTLEKIPTKI